MSMETAEKVTADHLRRDAYLYVRQSTLRQVMENTTSTQRQYGLRQRALALGWPAGQIVVIDDDLGGPVPPPRAATGSSGWSPTSAWARPGS